MIKQIISVFALSVISAASPVFGADWTVDPEASTLSFVSIKNGDVAEAHSFGAVSGTVDQAGAATIEITLGSVDTSIDIRNERMREILFNVADYPVATITANIDLSTLEGLSEGARQVVETEFTVSANDHEASYDGRFNVTRAGADSVMISPASAIAVAADDLGYGDGINQLRELAGLDAISLAVPVTFDLLLKR